MASQTRTSGSTPRSSRDGYLPKIVSALSAADPADAATFQANAAAYAKQLDRARRATWWPGGDDPTGEPASSSPSMTRSRTSPRHFGFEVVGVVLANVGQEPTAADLASLVQTVKAAGVRAVFSEAQFNPKLAHTLADEAGISGSSRRSTTTPSGRRRPAPISAMMAGTWSRSWTR